MVMRHLLEVRVGFEPTPALPLKVSLTVT